MAVARKAFLLYLLVLLATGLLEYCHMLSTVLIVDIVIYELYIDGKDGHNSKDEETSFIFDLSLISSENLYTHFSYRAKRVKRFGMS